MIRPTPGIQRSVSDLYSMKVHSVCVRSKSNTNRFISWRERATKQKEPLKLEMAPVNQETIGEMELVPSAVGPNPIEQRCQTVTVRTLRRRVESRGGEGPPSSSSGAWRFLRGPGPRVLLGPVRKDKKTSDLQDPSSASVSALIKRDCNRELAEGELASCPRGLPARKRQRAERKKKSACICSQTHARFFISRLLP